MNELWFHIDMDAFFASIEQLDNPEYRGKPVIVGAQPGHRGVVSTCSYEARTFGVHSAMPINQAFKLCPRGIFVAPRMARYQELSHRIMVIFGDFTPRLIQVSVDEAFLDMKGTGRLLGNPEHIASTIKKRVLEELGLTLSIGIASNKLIAKMASGFKKPNGLTLVPHGAEDDFVAALPIGKIWGLGKKTLERLYNLGIRDTNSLRALENTQLRGIFGPSAGDHLYRIAHGIDPGIYEGEASSHSISRETTFDEDLVDTQYFDDVLFQLVNSIQFSLHQEKASSRTLAIKIRTNGFETFHSQKTVPYPLNSVESTMALARDLFAKRWDGRTPLRLVGLGFHNVEPAGAGQGELFETEDKRRAKVEEAVMELRAKYQGKVIRKARLFTPDEDEPKT